VCSGSDAAISKTATGNLDVQFNNQTVTTGGVTISGVAGGFNDHLKVTSANGANPNTKPEVGNAIDISSTSGNVAVTTIAGAPVSSSGTNGIFATTTTGAITINTAAVTTNSTGNGINAVTTGGGISITTNGIVQSTGGNAILTQVTGGTGNTAITFNADVLYGRSLSTGIRAAASSTGSMSVTGSGNITGGDFGGLILQNTAAATGGDLTINTSGNFSSFIQASITQAANNANISINHTGTVTSAGGLGSPAISATTAGGGNVSITTTKLVQTGSPALDAILARTTTGAITINSGAVTNNSTGN